MTPQSAYQNIVARLLQLRRKENLYNLGYGLALIWAITMGVGLGFMVVEAVFYLRPVFKMVIESLFALIIIGLIVRYALYPFLIAPNLEAFALRVETHFGGLQQQVISALQLWNNRNNSGQSTALIEASVLRANQEIQTRNIETLIQKHRPMRMAGVACVLCLFGLVCYIVWPTALGGAFYRLSHPQTAFERPSETRIALSPGNAEVIAGEPFEISAHLSGIVPLQAHLYIQEQGVDIWTPLLLNVRQDTATHHFPSVVRSFSYRLQAHDAQTPLYELTVLARPVIARITHTDHFPAHTGLPDRPDQPGGDIVVPVGTSVSLQIETSQNLDAAWLNVGNTPQTAQVNKNMATAQFVVTSDVRYTVGLRDLNMISNRDPVEYRMVALPDLAPDVRLLHPGADSELDKTMQVELAIEAFDDYGIAKLEVRYHLNDETVDQVLPIAVATRQKEMGISHLWDMSAFDLLPGDQITYRVRAYDNNPAPNIGETAQYVIRFPSLFEIHQEAERAQRESLEEMAEVHTQSETLREKIDALKRDLIKSETLDWQEKQELEEAIQTQQQLAEKLETTAEKLEQTLDRLEQSGLLQNETLEKLQEIQNLLSQIQTPELQKAMEKLQEAMKTADSEQVRQALEAFQQERDQFQRTLDRTIALLQRVQQEQTLDALNQKLHALAKEQNQVSSDLNQKTPLEDLARRESQIAQNTEQFQQELQKAAEQMPETTSQDLQALSEAMQQQNLTKRMAQAQQNMSAGKREQAHNNSRELSEDLQKLAQHMQQAQQKFLKNQKTEMTRELKRVLHDLLSLSRAQEQTAIKADGARNREEAAPLALEQARTMSSANRMAQRILDAAQQSFFVPPQTEAALGKALKHMEEAAGHLNNGNSQSAAQQSREAMGALNNAAMMIQNALGQMSASASGTGFDEMMQQMAQLSEQQGDVNAQMQSMFGNPQPGMGNQPGWEQMAARQQAIQQALNALRQKLAQQRKQAMGDMGKISGDMEETVKELRQRQITPETLNRQQDILSRMLDAQKSMRQRGKSRQRESQTGDNVSYRGPGSLPNDLGEADNPLRRYLRDALKEGYSAEYQTMIRRYFEALMNDAIKPSETK